MGNLRNWFFVLCFLLVSACGGQPTLNLYPQPGSTVNLKLTTVQQIRVMGCLTVRAVEAYHLYGDVTRGCEEIFITPSTSKLWRDNIRSVMVSNGNIYYYADGPIIVAPRQEPRHERPRHEGLPPKVCQRLFPDNPEAQLQCLFPEDFGRS